MDSYRLPDGREITLRPIRADDRERLRAHHLRLSPESRYRRFLASKPELTEADARYLVDVDGEDHVALVAAALDEPGEPLVGVARYIRIPTDPDVAEFAVVVVDDYQRQGVAGALMAQLAEAAAARGIKRFRATMFSDNAAIHHITEGLAAGAVRRRMSGSVVEAEIDLAAAAADDTPAMIAACAGP